MAEILKIDDIKLSPFNIFVGHGYLQHAGAEYLAHHNLRYHVNLVFIGIPLNDPIAFARECRIGIAKPGEGNRVHESDTVAHDKQLTLDFEVVRE